jgi:hypothetical protein
MKLRDIIREELNKLSEIKRTTSLVDGNIDYNQFVDWAKGEVDKITKLIDNFSGLGFQWSENNDGVKLIIYKDESPIGYVGLNKFENGYKISTLGVKDNARGLGVATKAYYILIKCRPQKRENFGLNYLINITLWGIIKRIKNILK